MPPRRSSSYKTPSSPSASQPSTRKAMSIKQINVESVGSSSSSRLSLDGKPPSARLQSTATVHVTITSVDKTDISSTSSSQQTKLTRSPSSKLRRHSSAASMRTIGMWLIDAPNAEVDQLATAPASRKLYGDLIATKAAEDLCQILDLSYNDLAKLRKQYHQEYVDEHGTITQTQFFHLVREEKRPLTAMLFQFARIPPTQSRLTFDEYVCCACGFAALSEQELLRFVFDVYCESTDGVGLMERDIERLTKELQSMKSSFRDNIAVATKRMKKKNDRDHIVTFEDFERLMKNSKVAFLPVIQMQRHVRSGTLGEAFWLQKIREKSEVTRLMRYMKEHFGALPPLPWADWFLHVVCGRETTTTRLNTKARGLYHTAPEN